MAVPQGLLVVQGIQRMNVVPPTHQAWLYPVTTTLMGDAATLATSLSLSPGSIAQVFDPATTHQYTLGWSWTQIAGT